MDKVVSSISTPVGEFYMVIEGKTVIKSGFGKAPKFKVINSHPYTKLINDYFNGDKTALNKIPYAQTGSPFTCKTWEAISKIPFGQVQTYSQLAEIAGNKKAVRATGTACGKNNIVLIVPCHRVIKSDGGIGKYSGGLGIKELLLSHESQL